MRRLLAWLARPFYRPPDFYIGGKERPYIRRWYVLPRNRWLNVYLHNIRRDDDDRARHDHPWRSLSLVLRGGYTEDTPAGRRWYGPGSVIYRPAEHTHRLELPGGRPCWTLFLTGPRVREWGFHCPKGWVPWTEFVDQTDAGNVGRGCGEKA